MKNFITQMQILIFDALVFSVISSVSYLIFLGIESLGIFRNIISNSELFAYLVCQFIVITILVSIVNEFFIVIGGEK